MDKREFIELCERKLEETKDPNSAPITLTSEQSAIWRRARAELLNWVLEMIA